MSSHAHQAAAARCLALVALAAVFASACSPVLDLRGSLAATAQRFYADLVAGQDPYSRFPGVEAYAPKLPVASTAAAEARVLSVAPAVSANAGDQWQVEAQVRVGSNGVFVTYTELTKWAYRDRRWMLQSVDGHTAGIHGWSSLPVSLEAGLVAFGHQGRVWLLATDSGELTPLPVTEEPVLHAGWSPDGRVLLLQSPCKCFVYSPGDRELRPLGNLANAGEVTWSPDGRYAAIDSGTDVVRQVSFFDLEEGRIVFSVGSDGMVIWGPEPGTFAYSKPVAVDPPLPGGDGNSRSLAVGRLGDRCSVEVLARGTASAWYSPAGYGRDGHLYYRAVEFEPGGMGTAYTVTWWRWDGEAGHGVRLPDGVTPLIGSPPHLPTIVKPADLHGPTGPEGTIAVSVSPGGRWGMFSSQDQSGVSGVYVTDLLNPTVYVRLVAGHGPAWRPPVGP